MLRIGHEGDPPYAFDGIVTARRLASGEIFVLDRGSRQLRFYTREGEFATAVGRTGGGPREFRDIAAAYVSEGDRIYVYDRRLHRLSAWSPEGRFVRLWQLPAHEAERAWIPAGIVGDRTLLLREWPVPTRDDVPLGTARRDTSAYYLVHLPRRSHLRSPRDEGHRPIAHVPGRIRYSNHVGRVWAAHPVPFSPPKPIAAIGAGRIHFASGDRLEIRVFDERGRRAGAIALDAKRRPVSDADIEALIDHRAGTARDENGRPLDNAATHRFYTRLYAEAPGPEVMPAFDRILADRTGHVWVREYRPPMEGSLPSRWLVFNPAGERVARVRFPARFRPLDIGARYVLGVRRDRFDVERVELYRLERPHA